MQIRLSFREDETMLGVEGDPDDDDGGPLFDVPDELVDRYQAAMIEMVSVEQAILSATGFNREMWRAFNDLPALEEG
jgi:hypothetical protein